MKPIVVFLLLCLSYLGYSYLIYVDPSPNSNKHTSTFTAAEIAEGKIIWQKYNCQSCHQIYGLGGYLGPDLTNYSHNKTNLQNTLQGVLQSGDKQMPIFKLSANEISALSRFLMALNTSGNADPRSFNAYPSGMIKPSKHEKN